MTAWYKIRGTRGGPRNAMDIVLLILGIVAALGVVPKDVVNT
jgi:hypothetical protein